MCRKLLILCFALVVIAMSTPVSAAPSQATPLLIDFNGEGTGQTGRTQAGWEGWDFDRAPTTTTFTKSFTVGGDKIAVELKGVKNDASLPGTRMRGDQSGVRLGDVQQDLFYVATTGSGVGLLGLDYIQVKFTMGLVNADKTFQVRAYAWDSAFNTYHDSYIDDYAAWGVVNPSTNGGYHTLRYDDPCTPEDENGIDKSNIPILAQHLMQGPDQDAGTMSNKYSSVFDVTTDSSGVAIVYGWFNGAFQGSFHMPINGIAMIPEPATVALLGLGGLALLRRRK